MRTSRGVGSYSLPTKESAHIGQMILSAMADDQADFILSYSNAVDAAREDGKPDPAAYVRQSYGARNPLRTVFQTPPTDEEYAQILTRLPPSGRADVQAALLLFNRYGEEIGVKAYEGRSEKPKAPRSIFAPPTQPKSSARQNAMRVLFPAY